MTICKFYANGFCRYGQNCRFEHIDNKREYYSKTYNRNDVRHSQPVTQNRVGFSFNQTLENISNKPFGQQMSFGGHSREPQISSFNRNVFQSANTSVHTNQRVGTFSFNRTLQQISTADRVPNRLDSSDDIEMDSSTTIHRMGVNNDYRESKPNTFGLISHKNNSNLKTNSDIYSNDSDLSESDKKQFESNSFTFKSIPICPPPQNLCF